MRILNEVVLNQALVRFEADGDDPDGTAGDRRTRAVIEAVQRDGTCWLSGTTWAGRAAMRVSVTSWRTTEDDIDRSAAAILACLATVDGPGQRRSDRRIGAGGDRAGSRRLVEPSTGQEAAWSTSPCAGRP